MRRFLRTAGIATVSLGVLFLTLGLLFGTATAQAPAPVAAPTWVNNNPDWDAVCMAQGADVAPGSPLALRWGLAPAANSTGGQNPYGYRHEHEFMQLDVRSRPQACRATIAAATARRVAYSGPGAFLRMPGYEIAGRPVGWKPQQINDAPTGGTFWQWDGKQVLYGNPDEQHNWSFLHAVVAIGKDIQVPFFKGVPGHETVSARDLALARIWVEADALAGIARQPYYLASHHAPEDSSDRTYARVLTPLLQAYKLGALSDEAGSAAMAFGVAAANFYDEAPGVATFNRSRGTQDTPVVPPGAIYFLPVQTAWAAAALYDFGEALGIGNVALGNKVKANARRLAHWVADTMYPDGRIPWTVTLPANVLSTPDGRPVASLAPYITANDRHDAGFDAGPWAYRGLDAGGELGDPVAAAAAAKLLAKWQGDATQWTWLVKAKGWKYAVPAAAALVGE